jgi:hypothetical protein
MPMLPIPDTVLTRFDAILDKRAVALALCADFKKCLDIFWISAQNIRCRISALTG